MARKGTQGQDEKSGVMYFLYHEYGPCHVASPKIFFRHDEKFYIVKDEFFLKKAFIILDCESVINKW